MTTKKMLVAFKEEHGLREDWHEPGVTAEIIGDHLDNAFGECITEGYQEFVVILRKDKDVMRVNLATLLAIATRDT